jgi:hypothetical protein
MADSSREKQVIIVVDVVGVALLTGLTENTIAKQCASSRRKAEKASDGHAWTNIEVRLDEMKPAELMSASPSGHVSEELVELKIEVAKLQASLQHVTDERDYLRQHQQNEQILRAQQLAIASWRPPWWKPWAKPQLQELPQPDQP